MPKICCWVVFVAIITVAHSQNNQNQNINPSILEDARVHPTSDGRFGFLYRTQDGISHAAKGDPGGAVHGRFTYTDPTGLKVNFNYNAGAQAVKQAQQEQQQASKYPQSYQPEQQNYPQGYQPQQQDYQPQQEQYQPAKQDYQPPRQQYQPQRYTQAQFDDNQYQPQQRYQPQGQEQAQQQYQPRYQPQYRPRPPLRNDIYDYDYEQRYRQ